MFPRVICPATHHAGLISLASVTGVTSRWSGTRMQLLLYLMLHSFYKILLFHIRQWFSQWHCNTGTYMCQKIHLVPCIKKLTQKCIEDLNVKPKTIKVVTEDAGEKSSFP